MPRFTSDDLGYIRDTMDDLQDPPAGEDGYGSCGERSMAAPGEGAMCNYPDCDCFDSEIIMTSVGYVEVYQDGRVVAFGRVVLDWRD